MPWIHINQNNNVLIITQEKTVLKYFNDSKGFIEYLSYVHHIYKNIEEYKANKKRKLLIVLMI